jgi:twitching motility protein PilJ
MATIDPNKDGQQTRATRAPSRPASGGPRTSAGSAPERKPLAQSSGLPLIGRWPVKKQRRVLALATGAALALALGMGYLGASKEQAASQGAKAAAQASALGQRLAKSAGLASQARRGSFDELRLARQGMEERLTALAQGGAVDGQEISATDPQGPAGVALSAAQAAWSQARQSVDALDKSQDQLASFQGALSTMNALDPRLQASAQSLRQDGAGPIADQIVALTQRMGKNANALAAPDAADLGPAFALGKDMAPAQALAGALSEQANAAGAARQDAAAALADFTSFGRSAGVVQTTAPAYVGAKKAWRSLADSSEALSDACDRLGSAFEAQQSQNRLYWWAAGLFALAFFAGLGGLAKLFVSESEAIKQAALRARENDSQNSEVMTLLHEISALADGDLTVKASSSGLSFTTAIAGAINYTTGELRALILAVRRAAQDVTGSADNADHIAGQMIGSARGQYSRLADAGARIEEVGGSMGQIANEAQGAVSVARQSEEAAKSGAQVVGDSIRKMDAIRQTIQDTSKKIKLLGESSTAIGEAASLIRDITKQISILALNAAIQAATAGEAGQGFSAVAEEVQRLALSSAEAARRIDELVSNIQTDAKAAVAAMEESTRQVVEGARGADQAGVALREIGDVATRVAQSVDQMASRVHAEANEAVALSEEMQKLREAAEEAMRDAESARSAVEAVKRISDELNASVAGFKV